MTKENFNDVGPTEQSSNPTETWSKIVKEGDNYILVNADGSKSEPLVLHKEGVYLILPKNNSNRKWAAIKKVDKEIAEKGEFLMLYKATRTIVSTPGAHVGGKLINEKLISFLSEEEQLEVRAIVDRAREAYLVAKNTPKTELEKAKEKMERLQAAYEKLLAEDNQNTEEEVQD